MVDARDLKSLGIFYCAGSTPAPGTMFRPASLYIGLRYTRAKRRNHFISFISLVSMLGIALGVTVLITVLSVMNGFDIEIRTKIFNMARQVVVTDFQGNLAGWQQVAKKVTEVKDVTAAAPYVEAQGMLSNKGMVQPVLITGIEPSLQEHVSTMSSHLSAGSFNGLQKGDYGIVIGDNLAARLGLNVGSKVVLLTPQSSVTPLGITPRYKRFTVVGLFSVGGGFSSYDSGTAFINLTDAQTLFNMPDKVSGLRLKINDLYSAIKVSNELEVFLGPNYFINNFRKSIE